MSEFSSLLDGFQGVHSVDGECRPRVRTARSYSTSHRSGPSSVVTQLCSRLPCRKRWSIKNEGACSKHRRSAMDDSPSTARSRIPARRSARRTNSISFALFGKVGPHARKSRKSLQKALKNKKT